MQNQVCRFCGKSLLKDEFLDCTRHAGWMEGNIPTAPQQNPVVIEYVQKIFDRYSETNVLQWEDYYFFQDLLTRFYKEIKDAS